MTNQTSREMDWFLRSLAEKFSVSIGVEKVSVEAVELGICEVDDFFIPTEVVIEIPDTLLYEMMIVDDKDGNEWLGTVAFYPVSPEWCLQVITKNGELVYRKPLPFPAIS